MSLVLSPPPQAQENIARHPHCHQPLRFLFRYPCLPFTAPAVPHPLEASIPCRCTRFPLAPWSPLNSQLAPQMTLRSSVPTILAQRSSLPRGPPTLTSPRHRCWGAGGTSEGTARLPRGQQLLAPPHTLSLGCWGGGEVLVGTLRTRPRASNLATSRLLGLSLSLCR